MSVSNINHGSLGPHPLKPPPRIKIHDAQPTPIIYLIPNNSQHQARLMHRPNRKSPVSMILNSPQLIRGSRCIPLDHFRIGLSALSGDIEVKAVLEALDLVGLAATHEEPALVEAPVFGPLDDLLAGLGAALGDVDGFAGFGSDYDSSVDDRLVVQNWFEPKQLRLIIQIKALIPDNPLQCQRLPRRLASLNPIIRMEPLHRRLLNPKELILGLLPPLEVYLPTRLLIETVAGQRIHNLELGVFDLLDEEELGEVLGVRLPAAHT